VDDIDLSIHAVLDGIGVAYLLYDYIASQQADGSFCCWRATHRDCRVFSFIIPTDGKLPHRCER
jgi:hypothetical protein